MADEDLAKNQDSGENSDVKKKGKGGLLKFILIPVILLVQAAGAYYLVFNVLVENLNKPPGAKRTQNLEVGQFFELDDIVVNPAGTSGRRYIVIEMGLETDSPDLIEEAKSKEIWIRDAIITLLTNKTEAQLLDLSARSNLKKQILSIMNKKMSKGKFTKVYFKKYIMQ
ncbi:MAG: flagellar basal body-associated protein FliL [bacterium]